VFIFFFSVYITRAQKIEFGFMVIINIQWVMLKGECIITFIYTKSKDPNYKLGDNPTNNKDLEDLLHIPRSTLDAVTWSILILYILNVYFILKRNSSINVIWSLLIITSYILYLTSFRIHYIHLPTHIYYGFIHDIICAIFLFVLIKHGLEGRL
jgi:hypothetical protein